MENKTQDVGQTRPRRLAVVGWAVAAHRDGRWLILPGRYETEAGARLTAEFAALGGKVMVVEVAAGPDLTQRSEAEEPSEAVRCSDLLGAVESKPHTHLGTLAGVGSGRSLCPCCHKLALVTTVRAMLRDPRTDETREVVSHYRCENGCAWC